MTPSYDLDVVVTRGDAAESVHRVAAAVVQDDRLVGAARDVALEAYWRSCAKPFQIMPFLESGDFDALEWGVDQLALSCASHGGEPEHVALAERMLYDLGLEEGDLACGVTDPLAPRGVRILRECGSRPTRLHNNCSGKHAAMLGRAHAAGWPTAGYQRLTHPVQRSIVETMEKWTGAPAESFLIAIDGCGVPVFGTSLETMARAFSRLAAATQRGDEIPHRIVEAMQSNPFLVGGTDRFDTILMEEAPHILCKIGAEGVHAVAVPEQGLGIALKVEDGAARAQYPALLALLQQVGALPETLPPRLAELAQRPVRDSRHEVVGTVAVRSALRAQGVAAI